MRFAWLNLERYGAFSDRRLHFRPESHVHIVHGANEAGKTTALSFSRLAGEITVSISASFKRNRVFHKHSGRAHRV